MPHFECVQVWGQQAVYTANNSNSETEGCTPEEVDNGTCNSSSVTYVDVLIASECWYNSGSGCGGSLSGTSSGTSSGGGGTSTSPNEDPVVTTPVVVPAWQQVITCLGFEYLENNVGVSAWLQQHPRSNGGAATIINNYLQANSCSPTSQELAQEAIVELMDDEECPLLTSETQTAIFTYLTANNNSQEAQNFVAEAKTAICEGGVTSFEEFIELKEPCDKINEQVTDTNFQEKVTEIRGSLNEDHEVGYAQNIDGNFIPLQPDGNHSLNIPVGSQTMGFIHTHQNPYEVPDKNGDGIPEEAVPHKILSDTDVLTFITILITANVNTNPVENVFASNYSSSNNNFTIRFTGNIADVQNNYTTIAQKEALRLKYEEYFKRGNKIKNFLLFLKNEIGIDGIRLFKMKNNGDIEEKVLNDNNNVDTIPCI